MNEYTKKKLIVGGIGVFAAIVFAFVYSIQPSLAEGGIKLNDVVKDVCFGFLFIDLVAIVVANIYISFLEQQ